MRRRGAPLLLPPPLLPSSNGGTQSPQIVIVTLFLAVNSQIEAQCPLILPHTQVSAETCFIVQPSSSIGPLQPQGVVSCSNLARTRTQAAHSSVSIAVSSSHGFDTASNSLV